MSSSPFSLGWCYQPRAWSFISLKSQCSLVSNMIRTLTTTSLTKSMTFTLEISKASNESRRGDTVLGQYSLLQPDGIRRTVDYRADDHTGFQATVNNARGVVASHAQAAINGDVTRHPNLAVQSYQSWPTPTAHPSPAPSPVAISRSSFSQTITHGAPVHHPWA
ncbi:hypothetical protein HW555_007163 [Spodoptera exigua]|uniref:Uncharacterized protein n=1 Tax=Spodoptera exigua TaxID=7107 RepID=A0A835GGN9_SPOEX|nr:hypothetical protein HW555_007163 [Spodoptera exigua]